MAEKRMFSNKIIGSDAFLEMPDSTQNLYFHLSMYADDDGFVDKWKSIMRMTGKKEDDYKLLIVKQFIIPFESGVLVIKDWRINNYLRSDRYKPTIYTEEKAQLQLNENQSYILKDTVGIPLVSIDKNSIDKNRLEKNSIDSKPVATPTLKHKYGEYKHILLKDTELEKLNKDFGEEETKIAIKFLDESIEMKGYKYKSHYLAMRKWVFDAIKDKGLIGKGNKIQNRGTVL